MASICIEGAVASTAPMKVYGGIQLSKETVATLAEDIKTGKTKWSLHHDPRSNLETVKVLNAFTRTNDCGHLEAVVQLEADAQEWEQKGGNTAHGFSVSGTEQFLGDPDAAPTITIAADAHRFSDESITAGFEELAKTGKGVRGCRLYQFAADPPAVVALTVVLQQLSTIPAGLLCTYIYDALKNFIGTHAKPSTEPSKFTLTFDRETGVVTHAYVETSSDDVLKHAIDTLPGLVDSPGRYEYSESEKVWKAGD